MFTLKLKQNTEKMCFSSFQYSDTQIVELLLVLILFIKSVDTFI